VKVSSVLLLFCSQATFALVAKAKCWRPRELTASDVFLVCLDSFRARSWRVVVFFDMGLEWVLPTSAAMRRAAEIAYACETTIYDAAFVALAESLSAIYITADERLARRLEAYPFVRFLGHMTV
jgi:hypothetical protein